MEIDKKCTVTRFCSRVTVHAVWFLCWIIRLSRKLPKYRLTYLFCVIRHFSGSRGNLLNDDSL